MFAFIITILLAPPGQPPAQKFLIQSEAVYLTKDDCMAGLDRFGKTFVSALPKGTRHWEAGECLKPETVDG